MFNFLEVEIDNDRDQRQILASASTNYFIDGN